MAKMFSAITEENPWSEAQVYEALERLPDEWRVFYSVSWQAPRGRFQGDGETDFVVLHPKHGLLVVEVKGGGIEIENGQWYSRNRDGRHSIHNPFEQAVKSKHPLRDYIGSRMPDGQKPHFGHAVAFPSLDQEGALGPEAPRSIIWDRDDLDDIERTVIRTCKHWDGMSSYSAQQVSVIEKALAPTLRVRRLMSHTMDDIVDDLLELTEQQVQGLRMLRRQRRALIVGGAGTGKTALAVERAHQLADDDNAVLMLCFNRPLGESLASRFDEHERVTAGSFHAFGRGLLVEAGMWPDGEVDQEFWNVTLAGLLPDAAAKLGRSWDGLIIDEGQDFHPAWWTALMLLLDDPDGDVVNVFADDNQNIYRVNWEPPFESDPFVLDVNCRNTNQIAERVNLALGLEGETLGVDGPEPAWMVADGIGQIRAHVGTLVNRLINEEGLEPADLAVLSTDRGTIDELRAVELAGWRLVPMGGDGIVAETVHRYKGLEAGAVVLVLPDVTDRNRPLIYVGMSRARALLFVIGPKAEADELGWE